MSAVGPPSAEVAARAADRLGALAIPAGALGRLGDLGVWICATQGQVPPRELTDVRLVIFAGDHGVSAYGVSAYPAKITAAMVRTFVMGKATVSALAAAHDVRVRVLDIGVDDDLDGVDPEVREHKVREHKVRRGSGAIHLQDALTDEEARQALEAGATVAAEEIAQGAQLLLCGDMGIGNTTPAAALVAAGLGLPATEVTGRGTGIDDLAVVHKQVIVQQALDRAGERSLDAFESLVALGSADLAAATGFMVAAARAGVPVLLDGVISVACALTAERLAPGSVGWFAAGHRSTEPAQSLALEKLGLQPLLELDMRLRRLGGAGSGAVAAVPVLRSAVSVLRDVALLADLLPDGGWLSAR